MRMFPFTRNNTSTPAGRNSGLIETSLNNTRRTTRNSPPYFSRLFSSPGFRNVSTLSPGSSFRLLRRNVPIRMDPPPPFFSFHSPVRHRLPQSSQSCSSRPRNAIEFLNHSNSSMMERALRVLESKRKERSNEAILEDELESERISLKRYRSNEANNSCPPLVRSAPMLPQDVEVISRPRLKPSISTTRPSSSKLPDQVSRLSSATLEAIAFGLKRRRPEEVEKEDEKSGRKRPTPTRGVISVIDENLFPYSPPPAAKRRATRDCETQTVFLVDSATSTSGPLPFPSQRWRPASLNRPTSVARFIAGLEARARANALSRRFAAPSAAVLTQADSLEQRHAKIRQMFADLTEKAVVDFADNSLPATTTSPFGANLTTSSGPCITSSSTSLSPLSTASSVAVPSVTWPSSKATESMAVSLGTAPITAVATSELVVIPTCSFAPALPPLENLSHPGGQDSTTTTTSITSASTVNLPFVFGAKPAVSTETNVSSPSTTISTSAPSFIFSMESTSQKSEEQRSSTNTSTITLPFTPPVAKPTSAFGQSSFGGVIFPSTSSAYSVSSVAVTSSTSSFSFALAKSTTSEGTASVSSMPNFDFSTASKPSVHVVSTTTSFTPLPTTSSSLPSLASSAKDNSTPPSAPLFNFPATITSTNTTTVAAAVTANSGTFSPTMTSTDAVASSTSSTIAAVQSSFGFGNTAPTTTLLTSGTSSMFNFSAKPASINTTMEAVLPAMQSTLTLPACDFSAKSDSTETSSVFPAPAITTTSVLVSAKSMPTFNFLPTTSTASAPTLFDFSKKPSTTCAKIGEATVPSVNFKAPTATAAATTTATPVPFMFPMKSAFLNGNTTVSSLGFPGAQGTPTAAVVTATTSASLFPFSKTSTSGFANGGNLGGPFGTAPFRFQNSSNLTAVTSTGGFTFTSPSATITTTSTTPVSFSFTSTVTTATPALGGGGLGGFNFSSGAASVTGSSTPFAPKPGTGVFQFGAQPTAVTTAVTTTSSTFSLTLSSTKSSPSIFTNDHAKRTGDSSFIDGLSASKPKAPSFGGGVANLAPFSGTGVQPFSFGGSSGAVAVASGGAAGAGSGGFNFSAAVTNPMGTFNFSQTQTAPSFSGSDGAPPNPFSAVAPTAPSAAATSYQRRRQIRHPKRR